MEIVEEGPIQEPNVDSDKVRMLVEDIISDGGQLRNRDLLRRFLLSAVSIVGEDLDRLNLKILTSALVELRRAFDVFQPYRSQRKVTVFGSARTPLDHPSALMARELTASLREHQWLTVTGGGPGIMRAAALGAGPNGHVGVGIRLPFEAVPEDVEEAGPRVEMKYFFTRKVMLVKESDGFVSLPGGLGTLDETFELLTLMQTGKAQLAPLVLLHPLERPFWNDLVEFIAKTLLPGGYISSSDLALVSIHDTVQDATDELLAFYTNYCSMRWVGNQLVLRLKNLPSTVELASLNREFSHICTSGSIAPTEASAQERSENDALDQERLALTFNRTDFGNLRRLIDALNGFSRKALPQPT